ncbi:MAG: hypothetical protein L3J89_01935 [Gammaproteobacteria bacterium]|nr:hypothetical protein [Gammaproteobacteria bacterium]
MSNQYFQVIINGQLVEGAELTQTRQNIAKLFKARPDAVEPMFSGKRISVKKNLDQATARKYQQFIIKAGLKAGVAPMPGTTAPAEQKPASAPPQEGTLAATEIAAVGSIMDSRPPAPEANIDTSAYDMDEVGIILDEKPLVAAAEIDTSAISMHEAGVNMMEYEAPPKAEYDLSQLSLADAGETLVKHTPVPPAEIDTSNLEMK